jgi:HEAT repeat protein
MLKALSDKNSAVREAAARSLGKVNPDPKEVVPKLLEIARNKKEPEGMRIAAMQGLGSMGPDAREALPTLRKIAREEKEDSRRIFQAAQASPRFIAQKK